MISKLKELFSGLKANDPIIGNMMTLASGTAGAQVLGLVTMPLVIRLYSPEHFGILAVFVSILSMFTPFATFRYTVAIPLPKQTQTALNLMALSVTISFVLALLMAGCFFVGSVYIFEFFSASALQDYWWLLPIALFLYGLYETLIAWSTREKHFSIIAKTRITQSLSSTSIKLLLGWLNIKPFGLLLGQIMYQSAGIGSMMSKSYDIFKSYQRHVTPTRMLFLAKRYSDFPKYQIVSKFLLSFTAQTPLMYVAWRYDSATTGQLSLSLMILSIPINLISNTMSQAYYGEIAKIGRRNIKNIKLITYTLIRKLFFISLVPFIILFGLGEPLFEIVFGEAWLSAGKIASILSFVIVSRFVSSPFVNILNLYEKQYLLLKINLVRLVLMGLIFTASTYFQLSIYGVIWVYSLTLSMHYLYTLYVILVSINSLETP